MTDNFDLKKFLIESKALQNLNPILFESKENDEDMIRKRIREMIITELGLPGAENAKKIQQKYNEMFGNNPQTTFKDVAKALNLPEEEVDMVLRSGAMFEAKKKDKEVEDVEVTDTKTEDFPIDDEFSSEETPDENGGLEDIAADMEGDESELMNHLMSALKMAKGMNNEKLETQIGNTLKFFVSEYIGGGNQ